MAFRTKRFCKHLATLSVPTPPKLLGAATKRSAGTKPKRPFADNYERYDTSGGFGDSTAWQDAFAERMGLHEATRLVGGESPLVILGLGIKATWYEIRKAYRKLAMGLHPDRNPGKDPAAFRKVCASYEILEDQMKRGLIS